MVEIRTVSMPFACQSGGIFCCSVLLEGDLLLKSYFQCPYSSHLYILLQYLLCMITLCNSLTCGHDVQLRKPFIFRKSFFSTKVSREAPFWPFTYKLFWFPKDLHFFRHLISFFVETINTKNVLWPNLKKPL